MYFAWNLIICFNLRNQGTQRHACSFSKNIESQTEGPHRYNSPRCHRSPRCPSLSHVPSPDVVFHYRPSPNASQSSLSLPASFSLPWPRRHSSRCARVKQFSRQHRMTRQLSDSVNKLHPKSPKIIHDDFEASTPTELRVSSTEQQVIISVTIPWQRRRGRHQGRDAVRDATMTPSVETLRPMRRHFPRHMRSSKSLYLRTFHPPDTPRKMLAPPLLPFRPCINQERRIAAAQLVSCDGSGSLCATRSRGAGCGLSPGSVTIAARRHCATVTRSERSAPPCRENSLRNLSCRKATKSRVFLQPCETTTRILAAGSKRLSCSYSCLTLCGLRARGPLPILSFGRHLALVH